MQQLGVPGGAPQSVLRSHPGSTAHAYFLQHRAGDVADVWIDARHGQIENIFPLETPDFWRQLRSLLATLGTVTFLVTFIAGIVRYCPQVPRRQ
jgi:hypothetical protein